MLNIDLQELKDKGSIIFLNDGSILKGINDELIKVLDNIDDQRTESNKKRKIKIEFTIEPNSSRDCIDLSCDVNSALAPKNVLGMKMALTKDEENNFFTMRENTGEAEGQMTIEGTPVIAETVVIELPYKECTESNQECDEDTDGLNTSKSEEETSEELEIDEYDTSDDEERESDGNENLF